MMLGTFSCAVIQFASFSKIHASATRIALLHGLAAMANAYQKGIENPNDMNVAVPKFEGLDPQESLVLEFLDLAATAPKSIRSEHIDQLKAAGIAEADIVRICELTGYLAYEARV